MTHNKDTDPTPETKQAMDQEKDQETEQETEQETGIHIEVQTRYLEQQSAPQKQSFAFSYTITILNLREEPVKLLSRHWIITDQSGKIEEVEGQGVVGKQPVIEPGGQFQYSSGAVINTEIGDMKGSYTMQSSNGETFETAIPLFVLALPHMIH